MGYFCLQKDNSVLSFIECSKNNLNLYEKENSTYYIYLLDFAIGALQEAKLIAERNEMSLKDMVKDNKKVNFTHYFDGALWYTTDNGFAFPVPIDDIGNATFKAEDKALLFMRYIRKHLDTLDQK